MRNFVGIAAVISILIVIMLLAGCVTDTGRPEADQKNSSMNTEATRSAEMPGAGELKESFTIGGGEEGSMEYLTYYNKGIDLSQKGSYDEAVEAFTSSINANSSFTEAYFQRGLANYYLGRKYYYEGKHLVFFTKAVEDFSTVLQTNPSDGKSLTMRGWSNFWIGDYYKDRVYEKNLTFASFFEKGIDDCSQVLNKDPNNVDALNGRSLNYIGRMFGIYVVPADGTYLDKAKADAETSLRINSTNPWAYYALGRCYMEQNGNTLAYDAFSHAIQYAPGEAFFYYWRAEVSADYQKALDDYTRALELQPKFSAAHNDKGVKISKRGSDYESSLAEYEKAIEIDPSVALYYNNYAKSLWNGKWWDKKAQLEVLRLWDKALEIDPTYYQIYGDRAIINIFLNRRQDSTNDILVFQQHAKTVGEFQYAQQILSYNGKEPWYYTDL